jgi:hypothetical protein
MHQEAEEAAAGLVVADKVLGNMVELVLSSIDTAREIEEDLATAASWSEATGEDEPGEAPERVAGASDVDAVVKGGEGDVTTVGESAECAGGSMGISPDSR